MLGISTPFGSPYRESTATTSLSDIYDCAVNGLPFRLDSANDAFKQGMRSIEMLRSQADTSAQPGEQSISREELWRRSQDSWHKGAGQRYRDKDDSDPYRFWESRGIDPWTKGQLSLQHEAAWAHSSTGVEQQLLILGDWAYLASGNNLYRSTAPTTSAWSAVTRPVGGTTGILTSATTDGYKVWFTSSDGVQVTTRGAATATAFGSNPGSGAYNVIAYVRGRLVGASAQFLYDINGAGSPGTAINSSFGNTDWRWTAIAEGTSAIYVAGFSGTSSQIFRTSPPSNDPNGTLGPPVAAAPPLPTGEIVQALYSYLGIMCIGTSAGVRIATVSDSGDLTIGSLIPAPSVKCFAGSESFVWFGYSLFGGYSGLGRLDLAVIQETAALTPAYATDIMTNERTGTVTSVKVFQGKKLFAISTHGVFAEQPSYVSNGWLTMGRIGYGLIETKVAERVDVRHEALSGTVEVQLSTNGTDFISLGTNTITGTSAPVQAFSANSTAAEHFDLKLNITRDVSALQTPVIKHMQLRAFPVLERGYMFLAPLLLAEYDAETGPARHPLDDFNALTSLIAYTSRVTYQELSQTFNATVEDYDFARGHRTTDGRWWNGTLTLRLKVTK